MKQRKNRWTRTTAALALAAFLPLTAGCFGSFSLVRKVYDFNGDISSDKWVREGAFLLLNIPFVPVYSLAAAVDALFLNSIEFWGGEQLLAQDETRTVEGDHGEIASATFHPDGTADLTIVEADGTEHAIKLAKRDGKLAAFGKDGEILPRVASD